MTVERKKSFIISTAFVVLIAVILYFVMKYLMVWLLPFVIGFICALILQKPITWLTEKTKIPRTVWAIALVIVLLVFLFGLTAFLGYRLYDEIKGLVTTLSQTLPDFSKTLSSLNIRFIGWLDRLPSTLSDAIRSAPASIAESGISSLSEGVSTFAKNVVSTIPAILLTTVISIVACCFITVDYNKIVKFVLRQFSPRSQNVIVKTKTLFMENIVKMLRGYLFLMIITFFELFFGFMLLRVDYAAALALLICIVDILPVLGTGTVLIPWGVIQIIIGNTWAGLGILLLYAVITIVRNILEPKIIGKQVGLPAIVTLIAMYLGLNLFGIFGLFAFPIIVIVVAKLQEADLVHVWKNTTEALDDNGTHNEKG